MQQYLDLVRTIQSKGTYKPAARENMPGTQSLFGHQFRVDLSQGFPLHTTKRMSWKILTIELMWFLNGDTNIKYLVDNGVNIWNEDAYQYYLKKCDKYTSSIMLYDKHIDANRSYNFGEFVQEIKDGAQYKDGSYTLGDCGFQYGRVWREWENSEYWMNGSRPMQLDPIDQISNVLKSLRESPESRRHIVTAIDPSHDTHLALYWCHSMFQFNCRPLTHIQRMDEAFKLGLVIKSDRLNEDGTVMFKDGVTSLVEEKRKEYKEHVYQNNPDVQLSTYDSFLNYFKVPKYYLDCQLYQRSGDVVLGVPYNTASYSLLTMIFAKMCNMIPGDFIHTFGDVHIYDNHKDAIAEQLKRTPTKLPTVHISSDFIDWSGSLDDILKKLIDEEHLSSAITLLDYHPQPAIKAELSTGLSK